jgi:hypothetical protein
VNSRQQRFHHRCIAVQAGVRKTLEIATERAFAAKESSAIRRLLRLNVELLDQLRVLLDETEAELGLLAH